MEKRNGGQVAATIIDGNVRSTMCDVRCWGSFRKCAMFDVRCLGLRKCTMCDVRCTMLGQSLFECAMYEVGVAVLYQTLYDTQPSHKSITSYIKHRTSNILSHTAIALGPSHRTLNIVHQALKEAALDVYLKLIDSFILVESDFF